MQSAHSAHEQLPTVPAIVWDTFSTSPLPQLVLARNSRRVLDANMAAAAILAIDTEALLGTLFGDLTMEEELIPTHAPLGTLARRFQRGDGNMLRLLVAVAPLSDSSDLLAVTLVDPTLLTTASPRDDLTGLSTRESLTPALNAALRRMDDRVAVAFLDLDNFKEVNDTSGHLMGDEILRSAAHAIRSVVRSVDTVIRFGGDEFVVVLPGISDVNDATDLTGRINRAIATATADTGFGITASIGVAIVATSNNSHFDALHSADQAMYEAKAAGGNQTRVAILV